MESALLGGLRVHGSEPRQARNMRARNAKPMRAGLERVKGLSRWRVGAASAGIDSGSDEETLGMDAPYPVWGTDAHRGGGIWLTI